MTSPAKEAPSTKAMILSSRAKISELLPRHMDAERFVRIAVLMATRYPDVANCEPLTVVGAVMDAARLGLEIGREAHLIAIRNNKLNKTICHLWTDYKGLAELARRSGLVRTIDAEVVYEADEFRLQRGTDPKIHHIPALRGSRKDDSIIGAYAVAFFTDGGLPKSIFLTREEIEDVRSVSRAAQAAGAPWVEWYAEQCKKTAVRRLCKLLPQTAELAASLELDNRADLGEATRVDSLLDTEEDAQAQATAATQRRATELRERAEKQAAGADKSATGEAAPQHVE